MSDRSTYPGKLAANACLCVFTVAVTVFTATKWWKKRTTFNAFLVLCWILLCISDAMSTLSWILNVVCETKGCGRDIGGGIALGFNMFAGALYTLLSLERFKAFRHIARWYTVRLCRILQGLTVVLGAWAWALNIVVDLLPEETYNNMSISKVFPFGTSVIFGSSILVLWIILSDFLLYGGTLVLVRRLQKDLRREQTPEQIKARRFLVGALSVALVLALASLITIVAKRIEETMIAGQYAIRVYYALGLVYLYTLVHVINGFDKRSQTPASNKAGSAKHGLVAGDTMVASSSVAGQASTITGATV
ncbi:uncharacterized protein SPPG_04318 [Spizellomyces punctatus DAOM BR117]|uniref:Uncharacterized protein n=1 Tax=Spizellomyces punctatus (strain DAOM BR117) TaxID=645134 RepID=A0A0L0HJD8_SPIPD|nr:uncharacterized protein SPPG_04318 [Spizellomyces punctatus DAOM BR117]KND01227.1 hypothetical protein SPPG_04318 [Spizellomyces punctatus DAOM BR117]|eukprot:XP_016609266.1 hypothetical protein SPPG_04318 [Spizellomyces punctatus DAOM BR117]